MKKFYKWFIVFQLKCISQTFGFNRVFYRKNRCPLVKSTARQWKNLKKQKKTKRRKRQRLTMISAWCESESKYSKVLQHRFDDKFWSIVANNIFPDWKWSSSIGRSGKKIGRISTIRWEFEKFVKFSRLFWPKRQWHKNKVTRTDRNADENTRRYLHATAAD